MAGSARFRVPRRILRGRRQRTHPHIQWAISAERDALVRARLAGAKSNDFNGLFRAIYGDSIGDLMGLEIDPRPKWYGVKPRHLAFRATAMGRLLGHL